MEARLKELEENNKRLKYFKKIVKNSTCVQCLHCGKFIKNTVFVSHIQSCVPSQVDEKFEDFPTSHQPMHSNGISISPRMELENHTFKIPESPLFNENSKIKIKTK